MQNIETELLIAAPPDRVWRAFLDRPRWRSYSNFMDLDPGRPLVEGSRFWFGLRLGGLLPAPIQVRVLRRIEGEELCWAGKVPGFRGEHYFRFHPEGDGWTRMTHGEDFSGVLAEISIPLVRDRLREMYAAFNAGLAQHVEQAAGA